MTTVPRGYREPEIGDHVEERKLELQDLYCPARKSISSNYPDVCTEKGDLFICFLELGRSCDLRMQLIKEEKEGI